MKIRLFLFAAGLALAGAFILSCSSDDGGGGGSGGDQQSYSYCLYIDAQVCVAGLYKDCPAGGIPSNSCPYGDVEPSSSSVTPSSSSAPPSSSSEAEKTYKTVAIGTQTWMAENLNYAAEGSKCYSNLDSNCDIYGRLYNWATAMGFESSCNSSSCSSQINSPHRGICPSGWHIPSNADWDKLFRYADGTSGTSSPYDSPTAGKYLKAVSGWNSYSGIENLDSFGFSALPGGYGLSDGSFYRVGYGGYWWSASEYEYGSSYAYIRYMSYGSEVAYWSNGDKSYLRSVRCLQD
jgi:uncharacterized protein (TIGR02145 family)